MIGTWAIWRLRWNEQLGLHITHITLSTSTIPIRSLNLNDWGRLPNSRPDRVSSGLFFFNNAIHLCHLQRTSIPPWQRSKSTKICSRSDYLTSIQHGRPINEAETRCSMAPPPFWCWWEKPRKRRNSRRTMLFMYVFRSWGGQGDWYWLCQLVLVAWLRISCDSLLIHSGRPLHCHNIKERYSSLCGWCAVGLKIWLIAAKHLEPLKGGKVALEVLVRGKDAEQNEALFRTITEKITGAGVSHIPVCTTFSSWRSWTCRRKWASYQKTHLAAPLSMSGRKSMRTSRIR